MRIGVGFVFRGTDVFVTHQRFVFVFHDGPRGIGLPSQYQRCRAWWLLCARYPLGQQQEYARGASSFFDFSRMPAVFSILFACLAGYLMFC